MSTTLFKGLFEVKSIVPLKASKKASKQASKEEGTTLNFALKAATSSCRKVVTGAQAGFSKLQTTMAPGSLGVSWCVVPCTRTMS
ncbi:hypothetical protein M0804_012809 [Polistes exclamans]|nr:hypothetical protein M0804_012809 [Polistes exclamans]